MICFGYHANTYYITNIIRIIVQDSYVRFSPNSHLMSSEVERIHRDGSIHCVSYIVYRYLPGCKVRDSPRDRKRLIV